jgi:hypothetical protein
MDLILFTLWGSLSIGYLVFLLFHSNFVYEYGKLLGQNRFINRLRLKEYGEWKAQDKNEKYFYPVFIREKYNTFWSRLFGCPICLSGFLGVWGSILVATFKLNCDFILAGFPIGCLATFVYFFLTKYYPN